MNRIIFNLAAKTDKAGRPSSPNQDNLWVCPDLAKWQLSADNIIGTDEDVELSNKGALLAVADRFTVAMDGNCLLANLSSN